MGCLNNIISNSKLYNYVFWFSVFGALLAVLLNVLLIERYGLMGAAWATLVVMLLTNSLKLVLVAYRLKMHPFSVKMGITLALILATYGLFFKTTLVTQPLLNILLKTLLISVLFVIVVIKAELSSELIRLYRNALRRLR